MVLYHPAQYPLARALCAHYEDLELWYLPPARETWEAADKGQTGELSALDELARERATRVLAAGEHDVDDDEPLRKRLRELGVINPHAFLPATRSQWRRSRLPPGLRRPISPQPFRRGR
jgi:hypothetical protein